MNNPTKFNWTRAKEVMALESLKTAALKDSSSSFLPLHPQKTELENKSSSALTFLTFALVHDGKIV